MDMLVRFNGKPRGHHRGEARFRGLLLGLLAAILVISAFTYFIMNLRGANETWVTFLGPVVISAVLAVVPVLVCFVQSTSKARQLDKLDSLDGTPVASTTYFRVARIGLDAVAPPSLTGDYRMPLVSFSIINCVACFMVAAAFYLPDMFVPRSAILGGMKIVDPAFVGDALTHYQEGTFVVACMAFVGSYVYALSRLLERVGNNDLYPISLHYYSAHLVIGCLVAAVLRHGVAALGVADDNGLLMLLGFATGVAPDLIIVTMLRRAFQAAKVFGSKADPDDKYRPESLPLLMLDDLTKEKVDRLNELGIDSAQALARQNPFVIWPRLPFDLILLVDWIAEAQLYTLLKAPALQLARHRLIFDIFDLETRLRDAGAVPKLCEALGIDPVEAPSVLEQLESDPSYTRLREVRDALLVKLSGTAGQVPQKVFATTSPGLGGAA